MFMANLNPTLSLQTILPLLTTILSLCSLSQTSYLKSSLQTGDVHFRMIHIDTPDSPMYQPELTDSERFKRLAAISNSRVRYLSNRTRYHDLNVIFSPLKIQDFMYFVEIGLGKFRNGKYQTLYLAFDTGDQYMWTQCEGCRVCFHQTLPYFKTTTSKTYHSYGCSECPGGQCSQGHCTVGAMYGGGTAMNGIWSRETLTILSPFSNQPYVIDNYDFVCAIEAVNFPAANNANNVVSGILGMGVSPVSFIKQLGKSQFSYCLQDYNNAGNYPMMTVSFGDSLQTSGIMSATPILTVPDRPYYYLNLIGISVDGKRLNINQRLFAIKPDNSGGTMIDSGATFSYIVTEAYNIMVEAIAAYIQEYSYFLSRHPNPTEFEADACWEPAFESVHMLPSLTFHFENNANLVIQPSEVMRTVSVPGVPHPGLYCLTIRQLQASHGSTNMIGTYQQINQYLIYDTHNSILSFAPANCAQ